jgi:hypothetical protein
MRGTLVYESSPSRSLSPADQGVESKSNFLPSLVANLGGS